MNALLIPGPRLAAAAWARGDIGDREFIFDFPRIPEAVLFATLPDLGAWARALPQLRALRSRGVNCLVLRTNTPAVCRHVSKWGAVWTIREPEDIGGKFRFWVAPEVFARYVGRIAQNSAATAGATSAR